MHYFSNTKIEFGNTKGVPIMLLKSQAVKAQPAWKTFLVELLTARAGFYISQQVNPSSPKRDNIG